MTEAVLWGDDLEIAMGDELVEGRPDVFEFGSLIAALCEETEDEFELDLRVRAVVESGLLDPTAGFRLRLAAPLRFEN